MDNFAKTVWDENGHLVAENFGDVYFSILNGLEETKYVFLNGNHLPEAWNSKEKHTIIETGFGTGLNFLATWKLWKEQESKPKLHFISVEKFPLTLDVFEKALGEYEEVANLKEKLNKVYQKLIQNTVNTIELEEGITLTLLIGDVKDVLSKTPEMADTWFLDGFSPAKNPEMWNQDLYNNMAKLSNQGATFATFTAAGHVRNGLTEAGFEVERIKGFGYKRHMCRGQLTIHANNI